MPWGLKLLCGLIHLSISVISLSLLPTSFSYFSIQTTQGDLMMMKGDLLAKTRLEIMCLCV